jgi:hypothetical protein
MKNYYFMNLFNFLFFIFFIFCAGEAKKNYFISFFIVSMLLTLDILARIKRRFFIKKIINLLKIYLKILMTTISSNAHEKKQDHREVSK